MARGRGRRRGGHGGGEESEERWLLTYADMITLLMALFMVLFSISSVNISKYEVLQHSLKAAFSGNILPGGKDVAQQGATANASHVPSTANMQALSPVTSLNTDSGPSSGSEATRAATVREAESAAAQHQAEVFAHIKHELDTYAKAHGFGSRVKATIEQRGLVIKVLTDDLLFASGQATLSHRSYSLLQEIAHLLNVDESHPIDVEGNTDNIPIHSGQFPSNWELSTARASTVVRFLIEHGVGAERLTAAGYADERPAASNSTPAGRALNRRVEIVMRRVNESETGPK